MPRSIRGSSQYEHRAYLRAKHFRQAPESTIQPRPFTGKPNSEFISMAEQLGITSNPTKPCASTSQPSS